MSFTPLMRMRRSFYQYFIVYHIFPQKSSAAAAFRAIGLKSV